MSPLTVNEDAVMSMQTDIDPGLKRWSDIGFAITERLLRLAPRTLLGGWCGPCSLQSWGWKY